MPARLAFAFLSSLLLHLGVLGAGEFLQFRGRKAPAVTPAMLDVVLRPSAAEPLLKDTLAETTRPDKTPSAARSPSTTASGRAVATASARRKLAEHLYYPSEAIARGLEGEVRLLLTLAPEGSILDADVADSSGHAILDQAAVRAAWAMGRLPGTGRREIILPVVFRLQP